jgi:hypothetical protein
LLRRREWGFPLRCLFFTFLFWFLTSAYDLWLMACYMYLLRVVD